MTQTVTPIANHPPLTLSTGQDLFDTLSPARLTATKARAVLQEYRRFLHLAATGPGPTVPSPQIDAVWHLHLVDTRAYADWCDKALGRFIHHSPGRAPQRNDPAYAQTLARYRATFGHPPPPRIWPSPMMLRAAGWMVALFLVGFALGVIGLFTDTVAPVALGLPMSLVSVFWLAFIGPWRFGTNGDSGGDGGCGD